MALALPRAYFSCRCFNLFANVSNLIPCIWLPRQPGAAVSLCLPGAGTEHHVTAGGAAARGCLSREN